MKEQYKILFNKVKIGNVEVLVRGTSPNCCKLPPCNPDSNVLFFPADF